MKMILILSLLAMTAGNAFAQGTHIVREGDVLSKIVLNKYPNPTFRVYGQEGKLKEILKLNPELRDPHQIYPNQVIILEPAGPASYESQVGEPVLGIEVDPVRDEKTAGNTEEKHWDIYGHYGAKFLSYSQTNTLGSLDVGAFFPSYFQLGAEYKKDIWAGWINAQAYKIRYESGSFSGSRSIRSYELGGSYQNFIGSLGMEDSPLFKESPARVEMSEYTLLYVGLGWRQDWNLKSTLLRFKSWLKYPVNVIGEGPQVKITSPKGYKAQAQLQWQYPFYKNANYELFADWQNDMSYQATKADIKWGTTQGQIDAKILEISTSLGLHLKY